MDDELRTTLWNVCRLYFLERTSYELRSEKELQLIAIRLQLIFFKSPYDDLEFSSSDFVNRVSNWFFNAEWYEVYDFIEYMRRVILNDDSTEDSPEYRKSKEFADDINEALEREKSGYRFVDQSICPIVDDVEIDAIEDATKLEDKFSGAREHMRTALSLYSDRRNPDYRNSVKEAISAIESAACVITGNPKATLGQALKQLQRENEIHPSMSQAFEKLYGYTSDSGGIRHAMLEESNITESEALFMIVTCSAFLNYLVVLSK